MKILFQGDSITHAGRSFENPLYKGNGYVTELEMRFEKTGKKHTLVNTAVGGDRICDLYARWIEDTLNHDFDILSLLCGINDVGFQIREGKGVQTEKFKFIYDRMMYEVLKKNPKARIVIMEPFIIKRDMSNDNIVFKNDIFENYDLWRKEVDEKAVAAREIAKKYNALFVPLADMFDEYIASLSPSDLTDDGIHPTLKAHRMIADRWLEVCEKILTEE